MASYYGITCVAEAKAYLEDEYLGSCLKEICQALLDLDTNDAKSVFGDIDAMKLKSSMTLFEAATSDEPLFANVLDKFFDGTRDERTLELISR